jgi:hypothetical protein
VRRFYKIGVPILIVLSMLAVVGTGIALAKGPDTAVSIQPAVYDGSSGGTCPGGCNISGCWYGGGYCPGPCGRGGESGTNSGNYPPCHGY